MVDVSDFITAKYVTVVLCGLYYRQSYGMVRFGGLDLLWKPQHKERINKEEHSKLKRPFIC